jgi:excisionase family DNA binding protein
MPRTLVQPCGGIDPEQLPLFMTVDQAADVLGIGRSAAYDAIRYGQLPAVRFGRRLRVPKAALLTLGLPEGGGRDDAA